MVEREAFLVGHLVEAMEAGLLAQAPIHSDVKTFDGRPLRGRVACTVGGYPCQPFSVAGRRRGTSDPRHLWPAIRRIVDEVGAPYCFFENVDDHLKNGFDEVAKDLDGMGYVVEAGIFSSAETGASHVRERLYIMAFSAERERRAGAQERGTSGQVRKDGAERDYADGPGERMGHSDSGKYARGGFGTGSRRRRQSTDDGRKLGYPKSERISKLRQGPQDGEEKADTRGTGKALDNSDRRRYGNAEEALFSGRLCPEPPSRNDEDGWRRVIESHPELAPKLPVDWAQEAFAAEPTLSRMADAVADRVDKVRAVGNGVDPVVAALAFSTLWYRIHG